MQDIFLGYKEDKFNITVHKEDYSEIKCGVKGYLWDGLTEHQLLKIRNTLYHELIHIREMEQIPSDIHKRLTEVRSMARMGYILLNEYVAYYEANLIYPELPSDLNSSDEEILNLFYKHMTKGFLTIGGRTRRTESDEWKFFEACYDNFSALIPKYIICGCIGDGSEPYVQLNKAVQQLAQYYHDRNSLTVSDYEKIGREFIDTIIYDLSSYKRKTFWSNTGIYI